MPGKNQTIGCILMASGLSERYGKNKLLEKLDGREIILHTAGSLTAAGLRPLAVTRNETVRDLMDREGIRCVLHGGPLKSDTIHAGLEALAPDSAASVSYEAGERRVRRVQGEAFFAVGADRDRPFKVTARSVQAVSASSFWKPCAPIRIGTRSPIWCC